MYQKKIKRKVWVSWGKWKWKHTHQNLWDVAKAILGGKFIAINAYIKKIERSHTQANFTLIEQEKAKPEFSRRKEIIV